MISAATAAYAEVPPIFIVGLVMIAMILVIVVVQMIRMIAEYHKARKDIIEPIRGIVKDRIRSLTEEGSDTDAPQSTEQVRVVAKRMQIWGNHAHTFYYATFELSDRKRIELRLSGADYGMLAEGDEGTLVYRGKQFVSFARR